jgi:hypothetical protein
VGLVYAPRPDDEIDWKARVEESEEGSEIRAELEDFEESCRRRDFKVRFSSDGMELIVYDDEDDMLISYWAEDILSPRPETPPQPQLLVEGVKLQPSFHIGAVAKRRPKEEIDWQARAQDDAEVQDKFEQFRKLWQVRGYELKFAMNGMMLKIYRDDEDCGSWWSESVLGHSKEIDWQARIVESPEGSQLRQSLKWFDQEWSAQGLKWKFSSGGRRLVVFKEGEEENPIFNFPGDWFFC